MQQRRQRPGDIVDDYCPRERRITDHAIVAMVEDDVQRTRCVVCDAEHEFKGAKVPAQRKKKATAALFTQVLDSLEPPHARPASPAIDDSPDDPVPAVELSTEPPAEEPANGTIVAPRAPQPPVAAAATAPPPQDGAAPRPEEGGFRRSLIRAQLPRPEGQPPPQRAMPEFTMHQPLNPRGRRGGHRPGQQGSGQGQGQGQGQNRHRGGGGGGSRRGAGMDGSFGPMRSGHGNPGQDRPQGGGGGRRRRRGGKKSH